MRAAVVTAFNRPWEIQELADPRPAPGQVLIKVHASGMCGGDLHVHQGHLPVSLPLVAGHEPAGTIVAVGEGVTHLGVGDRVGAAWIQRGCGRCAACQSAHAEHCPDAQGWMHLGGGNSELMLAWASGCALIPDGVPFELAAPIFCAGYTVMSGLRNGEPKPGERVAVLGLGGLGHLAVQYAKALGLETLALTGQASKRAELTALGADEVVVTGDDVGRALRDAGGADVILSTTSSARQIAAAFGALRPGGRLVNMGMPDGPVALEPMATIVGGRQLRASSQDERSDLHEALTLVARGKVKPQVETYPLAKVNEVRERLAAGKVRYRAVLLHAA